MIIAIISFAIGALFGFGMFAVLAAGRDKDDE